MSTALDELVDRPSPVGDDDQDVVVDPQRDRDITVDQPAARPSHPEAQHLASMANRVRLWLASVVIGCFLLVTLVGLIPGSATRTSSDRIFSGAMRATGVHQNWSVFSPDPLTIETHTYALIYFMDGTSTEWRPPTGGVVDSSRAERWRKWETRVRLDSNEIYWPNTARYIAELHADEVNPVATVRLVRTWSEVPPISEENEVDERREFDFYEWDAVSGTGNVLALVNQPDSGGQS